MAFDLVAVRTAIADRIEQTCSLRTYPFDVDASVYPRAIVFVEKVDYHKSMGRSLCEVDLLVSVQCAAAQPPAAQSALAVFCNAGTGQSSSVFEALSAVGTGETGPSLLGAVENVHVESVTFAPGSKLENGTYEFSATFRCVAKVKRD